MLALRIFLWCGSDAIIILARVDVHSIDSLEPTTDKEGLLRASSFKELTKGTGRP
jgi:hypothetical protein